MLRLLSLFISEASDRQVSVSFISTTSTRFNISKILHMDKYFIGGMNTNNSDNRSILENLQVSLSF